ncbi:MAG: glycine oxidase ThiO [Deltaproteobacteria bacterium]
MDRKQKPKSDVVIIGGGIMGCSAALRLAQAGAKVTLIERGEIGQEASAAAAGMLAPQGEKIEPDDFAELCLRSRDLYPQFAAEVEELSGERIAYQQDGTVLVGISGGECEELEETYQIQTRRGLPLERLTGDEARQRVPGLAAEIRLALFVPGDHWLDNVSLMSGLAKACRRLGVSVCTHSEVSRLTARNGRVASVTVRKNGSSSEVGADQFVLAAGCWSKELAASLGIELELQPCRGQMMEFETPAELPHVIRCGKHYVVPRGRRAILGTTAEFGESQKTVTAEGLRSILEGVTRIAPMIKDFKFLSAWSGLRPDTRDHLPVIGRGELANLVFATGHFRNGILLAPATAQLVSDLVLCGKTSLPVELYRPERLRK